MIHVQVSLLFHYLMLIFLHSNKQKFGHKGLLGFQIFFFRSLFSSDTLKRKKENSLLN